MKGLFEILNNPCIIFLHSCSFIPGTFEANRQAFSDLPNFFLPPAIIADFALRFSTFEFPRTAGNLYAKSAEITGGGIQ